MDVAMGTKDLSVVIITWRMKDFLGQLISTVIQHTQGLSYEIIVVDNASGDGTAELVRKEFPSVHFIENSENLGVAPSRNQGFRVARGKFVVILDADMVLKENSLRKMLEFMSQHPDAGICGCRLTYADGTLQPSARRYPSPIAFLLRRLSFLKTVKNSQILRNHEMAEWDRSDIRAVDYVIGACQFIRREAMEQVGLLDEHIFYGPEDIDYCLRMYRAGWKVYYFPSTSIVHYEQRITKKKLFSRITWRHLKGVAYLFLKYHGRLTRN
jgi:GT2 family glycosyltransferase